MVSYASVARTPRAPVPDRALGARSARRTFRLPFPSIFRLVARVLIQPSGIPVHSRFGGIRTPQTIHPSLSHLWERVPCAPQRISRAAHPLPPRVRNSLRLDSVKVSRVHCVYCVLLRFHCVHCVYCVLLRFHCVYCVPLRSLRSTAFTATLRPTASVALIPRALHRYCELRALGLASRAHVLPPRSRTNSHHQRPSDDPRELETLLPFITHLDVLYPSAIGRQSTSYRITALED